MREFYFQPVVSSSFVFFLADWMSTTHDVALVQI